jgi:hypothetical protein
MDCRKKDGKYGRWVPGDMQRDLEAARKNGAGSIWLPVNTTFPKLSGGNI